MVAKWKIPAFVVTLGTMTIYRSVAQYVLNGGGIIVKVTSASAYNIALANTSLLGKIPLPILYWLAFGVVIYLFTAHTPTGRHIYAVGSNEKATLLSSINVDRGKILGTVLGTLTLGIINNMMNLLGIPPFLVGAVKGTIIICAVLLQKRLDNNVA